jgi:CRP-like cAMP-binding protein
MMRYDQATVGRLRTIAPFDRCSPRVLRAMAPHVDRLRVRAGTVLAREGREPREFVVILSGIVQASRRGHEVGTEGAGAQIGADALVDHRPHDATWQAATDLDLLVVNGPAYRWVMQTLTGRAAA